MASQPTTRPQPSPSKAAFGRRTLRVWSPGIIIGLVRVVARRLWSHMALMLAIAAGFVVAIALVVSIPVYAEAVGYRILRDELSRTDTGATRPPFAFMYRYIGSLSGSIDMTDYAKLNTYMNERLVNSLGLPVSQTVRYAASDRLPLFPTSGSGDPLIWVNMAFATDLESHIEIVDGTFPKVTDGKEPLEVLLSEPLASQLGLQVGEEYLLLGAKAGPNRMHLPVRISGVWRVKDANDSYWFYEPETMAETLYVPEQSFRNALVPRQEKPVYVALWYLLADGSGIRSADVPAVLGRINRTLNEASGALQGVRLDVSPTAALANHQAQVQRLTIILTVFSIPILGLIAYFIVLVAGLVIQRQGNEIAVLRSRGASRGQVLGIYLLEWALMGGIALGLGVLLGQFAGMIMTWTRSFLDLRQGEPLPIALTQEAWSRAWQTLGLLVFASLLPAFGAARYTIVSFKSERARATRKPFWQRSYLDLLLLIPVYYGYSLLSQQGTLAILGFGGPAGDPFGNPLLLLAPSLYIFTTALVATRLFPLLMSALSWLSANMPGVATVTAMRYLARTPSAYTGPVLLLILTLSLATFTASMALTLDRHMYEQARYDTGGDMLVYDLGQSTQTSAVPGRLAPTAQQQQDKLDEARYMFLPVSDYLSIPGVEAATRVSTTKVGYVINGRTFDGQFIGVDRADLPDVAYWRDDYAPESLGALMNRLSDDPSAVLIHGSFASRTGLRAGDQLVVKMTDLDKTVDVTFTVVGYINLFPTINPQDGPFIVGNLDYVFDAQGGQYPYDVWMRVAPGTQPQAIYQNAVDLGLKVFDKGFSPNQILTERDRPERQGFFGLLSVGFVASAFLTVLGFLFYSVLSFQRRFVELGMLRAIGLSSRQLAVLLGWETALIIGAGMLAGTLIGVTASQLFIPFLQVRRSGKPLLPPFVVQIAWDQIGLIYAVFGAMLLLAVIVMLMLLRRMKLFQAVKLGEAI
ncbi:MAG: FtsX-like permease family protein [Roseiflexaceae bacterium]|nr:FtsX-like permease family protein [Roseiflexaceae bacterium]